MKRLYFLLTLFCLTVFAGGNGLAQAPTNGLVAYYPLNGDAQDASGNGNHGTAQNGVTFAADRFGNAGKAASFDGVNDRIMVNNHASLNFSSSFSSSFWVKMNVWAEAANNARGIISKKPNDNSVGYVFYKDGFYQSKINFRLKGNAAYDYIPSNSNVIINQWEFWTMVYNSTTGKVDIYKNGVLDKTLNTGNIGNMTNSAPLYIGFSETWTGYFNGSIDEVRMYNRALSAAEVLTLYGSENSSLSLTNPMRFGGGLSTLNVGTGYNLTAAIKNNGSTSWVGDVYLKVKGGTPMLLSSNNVIAAGGTYNLSTNFSPQTAQIGQNVTMELLTKQGSNDFVRVATVNGTVNPLTVNIEAASTVAKLPFLRLNQSEVSPGGVVQIVGGNFAPNTNVTIGSSPSIAGASYPSVTAGADGSISASFTVPTNITAQYLTFIGYDTQRNNPTASLKVNLPAEVATLSITSYGANQNFYILPNGSIPITIKDKLLKGSQYPLNVSSRSYKYIVSFRGVNTQTPSTWTMTTDEKKGLLNSDVNPTYYFRFTDPEFNTPHPSGNPRQVIMIVKDFYNPSRVVESVPINIIVEDKPYIVTKVWDNSWKNDDIRVKGLAADGVARIFLKIKKRTISPINIQSVSISLTSSENTNDPRWLGRVMYSSNQNLSVTNSDNLSSGAYTLEANGIASINAQSTSINANNEYWFWYVAPDDFQTSALVSNNIWPAYRYVTANIILNLSNGSTIPLSESIEIVRPPLMMVHGWMGDETSFSIMEEDNRFQLNWLIRNKNVMKPSSTFDENSEILLGNELQQQKSSFQFVIDSMRAMGYAANQVDYVCHSMGGLMLRNILSKKDDNSMERRFFQSDAPSNYTNKNYQKGWVHKYITINTPHFGSPGADLIAGVLPFAGETILKTLEKLEEHTIIPLRQSLSLIYPGVFSYNSKTNTLIPSPAVMNMQTNSSSQIGGRTNFKRLDKVKSHAIFSDIDEGFFENSPFIANMSEEGFYNQLFLGLNEKFDIDDDKKQKWAKVCFLVGKLIVSLNPNYNNTLFGNFIIENKQQLTNIWKSYIEFTNNGIPTIDVKIVNYNPTGLKALTETMQLWGQFNQKYPDFLWNGDAVVPLKSQISGLSLTSPNVSIIPNTKQTDLSRFHVSIQSKLPTIDRVFQLMNKSIHDIEFGYLEGNNYPQKNFSSTQNTTVLATNAVSRTAATNPYEVYDNTKIKITTPTQNTSFNTGSIVTVKVAALDTVNLKRVELLIGSDNISYGGKLSNYEYQYDVSKLASFQKTKLLAVGYYYINNEYYLKLDSVSISVTNPQPVSGFEANPMSKDLGLDVAFAPLYVLRYNDGLSTDLDKTKLAISISNPACLSYNTQTGQFKGTQKGEAVVIFTYDGIFKDTMYVAVGGGGLPYSQQIQTSNIPVTGDGTICTGATISVPFTTTGGVFDAGNQYIVQLSDASGENFVSLATTGTASPLLARIPNGLSNADTYKVRVVSTSPPVIGTAAAQTLKIRNQDATPIVSVQSGNWNDPATWSCKRIPSASDNVTIKAGHRVNLSVGAVGQCRNLTTERTAIFDCPTGAVFLASPNQ